jgi:hypothetical protein
VIVHAPFDSWVRATLLSCRIDRYGIDMLRHGICLILRIVAAFVNSFAFARWRQQ